MATPQIVFYGMRISGHAHRVQVLLNWLQLPCVYLEPSAAERASSAFRLLNPLGEVPVLQNGDLILADSIAIMVYLVRRYAPDSDLLPRDPVGAARVQRWLSVAAAEMRFGPAATRVAALYRLPTDTRAAIALAGATFEFMNKTLTESDAFLVGQTATLADLACYAYTAHAPEGGIALAPYPAIRAWISRLEAFDWFQPMPWTLKEAAPPPQHNSSQRNLDPGSFSPSA